MKKMIALMMALMFVLALAACSNGTKEPEAAPTAAAENNSSSGYTSSQGTIDGYDPNEKSDFVMNTSESTRTFNMRSGCFPVQHSHSGDLLRSERRCLHDGRHHEEGRCCRLYLQCSGHR